MSKNDDLREKSLKELPLTIKDIDKCLELLYNHKNYIDIANTIKQLEKAKVNYNFVLSRYNNKTTEGSGTNI